MKSYSISLPDSWIENLGLPSFLSRFLLGLVFFDLSASALIPPSTPSFKRIAGGGDSDEASGVNFFKDLHFKGWEFSSPSFGDEEALIGDDDEFISKSNFFCRSSVDLGCPAEGFWLASPESEDSSSTTCIGRTASTSMHLIRCCFPHIRPVGKVKLCRCLDRSIHKT
ncbi:hypothetical protein Hanom_Chr16g01433161 [Helianthus anomalus]